MGSNGVTTRGCPPHKKKNGAVGGLGGVRDDQIT